MKASQCIYGFSLVELEHILFTLGIKPYRARQVFSWIYKKGSKDFAAMTTIPVEQRKIFADFFTFLSFRTLKKEVSKDGTEKFLFQLADRKTVESVLIPEKKRNTLCVSTQVGCRFNCHFCASQKGGFIRNLKSSEIINQYLEVSQKHKITNLVYMGIGEPLDNFEETVKSIKILTDPAGADFTKRRISLSTCGLPDKIKELARLDLGIKLSLSLHAVTDQKRNQLMPINKIYPLAELLAAIKFHKGRQKYPVTFEYVLIEGFNTEYSDAKQLARLVKLTGAKLNLMLCNPKEGPVFSFLNNSFSKKKGASLFDFKERLRKEKIIFTLRKSRGLDISAACGQLRSNWQAEN